MWKVIKSPPGLDKYEIDEYGHIRDRETLAPATVYKDANGYLELRVNCIRIGPKRYRWKTYKVHRLVAAQFIGTVNPGDEVHHEDRNKSNPYYGNLTICTPLEHRRKHATVPEPVPSTPAKHGDIVLTEELVHQICRMLTEGKSFPYIRQELKLYGVTDDCIGKIAQGKNWKNIRDQYDIPITTRECMNSCSDIALPIAILRNRGLTIPQIAEVIGYDISSDKAYDRLAKCTARYLKWLNEGKWGILRKSDADKIIEELKNLGRYSPPPY